MQCLRMTVYIACAANFVEHSAVADGASAKLREGLGIAALSRAPQSAWLACPREHRSRLSSPPQLR